MPSNEALPARYETVTDAGPDAPWITMVHGVSQDHRVFASQVDDFRSRFRLLLIDMPGHGLSADLPGPYGIAEYAAGIGAALHRAGVERTHFWGTHLGAGAGLLLACRRPASFQSLVLEGPVFPGRPLPAASALLAEIASIARKTGIAAARDHWWTQGGWFAVIRAHPDECRAGEQRAIIDEFQGRPWLDAGLMRQAIEPIDDLLAKLEIPVLVMNGEHDLTDFIAAAEQLTAVLPKARRRVIERAGGFPLWEFPERVNAEVETFLASV